MRGRLINAPVKIKVIEGGKNHCLQQIDVILALILAVTLIKMIEGLKIIVCNRLCDFGLNFYHITTAKPYPVVLVM